MRVCYFDAFSGISGDMTVGALLDAGADAGALLEALRSLPTGADYRIEKTRRRGIAATKFRVETTEPQRHRHLPQILRMIEAAALPEKAKRNAAAVFERLGAVEAAVHGLPVEKVHFHEVGAADSIADIVGACVGLELLGVGEVYCSPVNVGGGTVETEHGMLPVPAPATAALLQSKPVYSRGPQKELTTPTGAAIAAALARDFGPLPPMRISAIGYGAGDHDFPEQANVLRVLIGETHAAEEAVAVDVLEANVDDATPELLGFAMERLLAAGALDVSFSPLVMKKSRPGVLLRVIARPEDREKLAELVLRETTSFGVRFLAAERRVAARRFVEVDTAYGRVRIKVSETGQAAPEYEDCRKLALETGAPLQSIVTAATCAYLKNAQ
jgi:uncharacterized protein (TIGR00299 family) protein